MSKKIKKVRKIRYGRIFLILIILFLIFYLLFNFIDFPIKNIYVKNNTILSDQKIIELAHLENYPSIFKYTEHEIEKKLNKNIYIKSSKVKKVALSKIYIEIDGKIIKDESVSFINPVFYYQSENLTYLSNGTTVKEILNVPEVINYIPDTIFEKFKKNILSIDRNIIGKISQIEYKPNEVDSERFIFYMRDGNYVYLNFKSFDSINNYPTILIQIINKYGNKNGILYLDEGDYFEILKN